VLAFRMRLPVDLALEIDLGLESHRFDAELSVPLVLSARAVAGLKVYIEVQPPRAREVGTRIRAEGLRASLLQRVAGVEGEVKRFVAGYVSREIEKPYVHAARLIDVQEHVDRAWAKVAPQAPSPTADHIGSDLREAIRKQLDASTRPPEPARDGAAAAGQGAAAVVVDVDRGET
jgi:hypothetical protein